MAGDTHLDRLADTSRRPLLYQTVHSAANDHQLPSGVVTQPANTPFQSDLGDDRLGIKAGTHGNRPLHGYVRRRINVPDIKRARQVGPDGQKFRMLGSTSIGQRMAAALVAEGLTQQMRHLGFFDGQLPGSPQKQSHCAVVFYRFLFADADVIGLSEGLGWVGSVDNGMDIGIATRPSGDIGDIVEDSVEFVLLVEAGILE
ncbi:hypothetical protein, partial [Mesorhizobium salmacidum]